MALCKPNPVPPDHYKDTPVEVVWAKPPNKYTSPEFRQRMVSSLSLRATSKLNNSISTRDSNLSSILQTLQEEHRSAVLNNENSCGQKDVQEIPQCTSATITNCRTPFILRPVICSSIPSVGRSGYQKETTSGYSPKNIILCGERNNLCFGTNCAPLAQPATTPLDGLNIQPHYPHDFALSKRSRSSSSNHTFYNGSPHTRPELMRSYFPLCGSSPQFLLHPSTSDSFFYNYGISSPSPISSNTSVSSKFDYSTPSLLFSSGAPSPWSMMSECSLPDMSLFQQPVQIINPLTDYQQRMTELFRNTSNSSSNSISYADMNIVPRNLEKEHQMDITGFIGDII